MVELRSMEETATCFPWAQPQDRVSSSAPGPIGADKPTPVPPAALGGSLTLGTTGGSTIGTTGPSDVEQVHIPAARSSSVFILRSTVARANEGLVEKWGSGAGAVLPVSRATRPGLNALPGRRYIVTEYEPHLRQSTVEGLLQRFERLRAALGGPETAARMAGLRRFLTDAYRQSAQVEETREFASAISLLQDFLYPHWSEISAEKLDKVTHALDWLRKLPRVTPRDLGDLHEKLSLILGGLSIEIPDEDDGPAEVTSQG